MEVDFIGMPMNLGCGCSGVERGTEEIRDIVFGSSRLHKWNDLGDIPCEPLADAVAGDDLLPYITGICHACCRLRDVVAYSLTHGHFPFIAGGDHVLSWGSLSGVLNAVDNPQCLYIDAHGDFNAAAWSPSHNVHGMHMCYLMGFDEISVAGVIQNNRYLSPANVFFSGTRSLDCYERQMADALNLKMSRGYPDYLNGSENLHISFDVDVLDPAVAPGTGVPEPDGLMLDEAMNVLSEAFRRNKVVSFDLVEFNPSLDVEGRTRKVVDEVIYSLDNDLLP